MFQILGIGKKFEKHSKVLQTIIKLKKDKKYQLAIFLLKEAIFSKRKQQSVYNY